MKVLIVDDSVMMRRLIKRALTQVPCTKMEVVEAADGVEALSEIRRHGPSINLVLCDLNMPLVNGLSLLMMFRSMPEHREIPFVIVTADGSDERTTQALSEGAAGVLSKPFRPEDIVRLVSEQVPECVEAATQNQHMKPTP